MTYDLVYVHPRKEIFPKGVYNKLRLNNIGPCRILKKILDNAYVLEFPQGMGLSMTLNVFDLYKFEERSMSDGREIFNLLREMPI